MKPLFRNLILVIAMVSASGLAIALRPTERIADKGPAVQLAEMIPLQFAGWREEPQKSALIVDPQQQATINRLYSQTLSRTYVNADGYRVMLSIAYGADQTDTNQVHKPEVCYPAQGFILKNKQYDTLQTGHGAIPITRIETTLGQRSEPVTYWITVGDRVVGPGFDKKLTELRYGLTGQIPDGLLFRVSSIDPDSPQAYAAQREFTNALLASLDTASRNKLIGNPQREQP